MSEAFQAAVSRLDVKKYIDQIEEELKKARAEVGPGRTQQEIEATQTRLQGLIRKQALDVVREIGLSGNHVFVFMAASTILTTAWLSFAIRSETLDLKKSPEERIALTDMLDALDLALQNVISAGTNYADLIRK